jgi:hypothetical protein
MDFVYNIDLVMGLTGSIIDLLTEAPNVINTSVAGGINLDYIQSPTLSYCLAHTASIARLPFTVGQAIHCLSQDAPGAGLTCSSGAAEKIGMRDTAAAEGVA